MLKMLEIPNLSKKMYASYMVYMAVFISMLKTGGGCSAAIFTVNSGCGSDKITVFVNRGT